MPLPSNTIGLDFETYSAVNLPQYGLRNYVACPYFTPLIAVVSTGAANYSERFKLYDGSQTDDFLSRVNKASFIVAHNAGFEQAVLAAMGCKLPSSSFIDSAVIARASGAAGKLEAAAPQLLGIDKMEEGSRLIKMFCIPGKYQEANGSMAFDPDIVLDNIKDWGLFNDYCERDSKLGYDIAKNHWSELMEEEMRNNAITMDMNLTGWHVDRFSIEEMHRRYLENLENLERKFRESYDAADLNLNSLKQLKEWCAERGIKANSFAEKPLEKLASQIRTRLEKDRNMACSLLTSEQRTGYHQVLSLIDTKQSLGGSSLKKLPVILDTMHEDRLHDQYLHVGAGQTYRTSGRSVQMQNLKRLTNEVADMVTLEDYDIEWDNDQLASNIRQGFTATDPKGALIVGDFSSVESRGLAWSAGAWWKVDEFLAGNDMYKVLAAKRFMIPYDAVSKDQRQFGKVGELSCGYQAGGGAVQRFAEKMGVTLTEAEAVDLVRGWRSTNPEIVQYWDNLQAMLVDVVTSKQAAPVSMGKNWMITCDTVPAPRSLQDQHPNARSLIITVRSETGERQFRRVFHGVYVRGNDLVYYKPSERKSGDLWTSNFKDPVTKQLRWYTIYGGKLAGILTQSLCREIFFDVLRNVHTWTDGLPGLDLVGQFHDEIVLDWRHDADISLDHAKSVLERHMSTTELKGFPLAAEIKHDYRYTK